MKGRGRNGIRVEGRSTERRWGLREAQQGRRESRGPRRSRSSRSPSRRRAIVSSSLPLLPRVFFVPVSRPVSLPRFLAPLPLSLCPCYYILPLGLSLSFPPARAVYSAVNGQAWSTDPRMACSCLLAPRASPIPLIHHGFPICRLSLIFGTDLPFSPSLSPRRGFSLRVALPRACSLRHPTYPTRRKAGREERRKTGERSETERAREGLPSRVLCTRYQGRE